MAGEIEASQDETEEDPALTSQLALLRMQLKEKRRQIEEEKRRTQVECEDQHRRLRQTAFWYVMGKNQRSEEVSHVVNYIIDYYEMIKATAFF